MRSRAVTRTETLAAKKKIFFFLLRFAAHGTEIAMFFLPTICFFGQPDIARRFGAFVGSLAGYRGNVKRGRISYQ